MTSAIAPALPDPVRTGPEWARAVATAVLADGWPSGDEAATWDVADRWYALADALSGPRMSAFAAAEQIVAGLVGAGIAPDGFREAWERLSGDDDAPLNALVQIAAELGQMVEECAREIEAAKLAAWTEIGTLLTELTELSIAIELTAGAAAPVAEALITASRVAVARIYGRLASRLEGEQPTRPPTSGPAHSARSEQRTIRLTVPHRPGGAVRPPGDETRKLSPADLRRSIGNSGMTTRRLAPRQSTVEDTRRLQPPPRPTFGRPTIPLQRTPRSEGHAFDRVRREEYADFLAGLAAAIRANLARVGKDPAPGAYADEVESEAARVRAQIGDAPGWARRSSSLGTPPWPATPTPSEPATESPETRPDTRAAQRDPQTEANREAARHGREGGADEGGARPSPQPEANRGAARSGSRSRAGLGAARGGLEVGPVPGWARARREDERSAEEQPPGGLRQAQAVHLKALRNAVPAADRLPDPRVGLWFSLLNAGGPGEDPTRGVNCLDAVLALFETYQRGRPRVAGARTFDGYAHGAPERPVGGEWSGVRRIQQAARSDFQNLCPFVGGAPAEEADAAVEAAFRNLANHLHNSGHGAFAFVLTDFASGGCHAWAAVNQAGTILFLDPQLGVVAADEPLYRDVVSMDALVVDGRGDPAPLPYHGAGQWTST